MKQMIVILVAVFYSQVISAQVKATQINPAASKIVQKKAIIPQVYTKKVTIEPISEWLCPNSNTRGDREFDGHGPKIKCEVKLRIGNDSTSLWADINFWAQETQSDWSTAEGSWSKKVYDAPYGEKIMKIKSDKASRTQFISPAAGFQLLVPGEDINKGINTFFAGTNINNEVLAAHGYTVGRTLTKEVVNALVKVANLRGNTVVTVPATEGALVQFFHIVGDTGGDDISNDDNCNDDTRINKIEFFPIQIEYRKTNN